MGKRKAAAYDDEYDLLPTLASSSAHVGYGYGAPGTSFNPIALDSPPQKAPAKKRQRKAKDPDAPVPEKRLAIMKKKCPANIKERLARVIEQRFFLVDRKRTGQELREEFQVLGTTGNVYTVVIGNVPSCNCPDALKGNHCKHILFIFTKVLQVEYESHVWYQKALLTTELQEIFASAPLAPNDMAHARVREAYAVATGKAVASSSSQKAARKIPKEDDDCVICYEGMHGVAEAKLAFCDTCRNALHKECMQQWARHKGAQVDCPICRGPWAGAGAAPTAAGTSRAARSAEGYLNLSSAAGLSPVRDASSYYHGPRHGQRYYGYQYY
ncbi:hypothetical protein PHLGIDRAFT_474436 [Phlebiopsis gigantea 11061_1 CR5-6]|uniref:SWIM-type domain-containing protein n=1 Tax=Phlebiopsis gigantea (strain 11061_1 CR5-6) TaxID=745531 RepID=A0A0C3SF41_PHLG1|nr:hypothetical protein PHLGIDRAFT_474436 [Phlebiopsis gigantea 11061_1 CR5-6]